MYIFIGNPAGHGGLPEYRPVTLKPSRDWSSEGGFEDEMGSFRPQASIAINRNWKGCSCQRWIFSFSNRIWASPFARQLGANTFTYQILINIRGRNPSIYSTVILGFDRLKLSTHLIKLIDVRSVQSSVLMDNVNYAHQLRWTVKGEQRTVNGRRWTADRERWSVDDGRCSENLKSRVAAERP